MRKTISILVACLITTGLSLSGICCKKNDFTDLRYQHISKNKNLQAYVNKKGGEMVLWFQVFDMLDEKSTFNTIREKTIKIDNYPAKIKENQWIIMLINKRIEIRLSAYTASNDFQNTDKLISFIKLFDLTGLEKITGPKLKPEELERFMPKLGGK